ncbi:hypothetical protein [Pseudoalteromonas sp. 1181_04]|uniref:hypothetical protein n=1 Tax=Pseudoalteromonas sp. 1181_04 TaxID=2604450 RepID=UPI004062ECA9
MSAELLSDDRNYVFIESTSLQLRKILELIAYLSILANGDKLNSKERGDYHAKNIIENLAKKATLFYPFPSHIIPPEESSGEPILIPIGYANALSQSEFSAMYQLCGNILHSQHPLKCDVDIENVITKNKQTLRKLKQLLSYHTVGIKKEEDKYTFLHVEIDFSNSENTRASTIREYNSRIFSERQLLDIFQHGLGAVCS